VKRIIHVGFHEIRSGEAAGRVVLKTKKSERMQSLLASHVEEFKQLILVKPTAEKQ
jgi:hypothetical protein